MTHNHKTESFQLAQNGTETRDECFNIISRDMSCHALASYQLVVADYPTYLLGIKSASRE